MDEKEHHYNPSTGSIMSGSADADGNLYGHGGAPYHLKFAKENKEEKPCTENDIANYVVWAVYIGFIIFSLVLISRHLS